MFSPEGYQALRRHAAFVSRGDRGLLEVTGSDRFTWLQGLLTNDVLAIPPGGVVDAAYLTPQGRMLTELRVMNLPGHVLLDVPGSLASSLQTRLDGLLFSEDAVVTDVSARYGVVDLHGPSSAEVIAHLAAELEASGVETVADAVYGVPGYTMIVAVGDHRQLLDRLRAAGTTETTLETLDVLRVEAGRPAFLLDMDEHTIPLEAGLEERAISFSKGCYVGQEVIIRVMHRGHGRVAKKLVGLLIEKGQVPAAGDAIARGDRDVGRVTSAVWSPLLERPIALGYVHRDFVTGGTELTVLTSDRHARATVTRLPFRAEQLG